MFNFNARGGHDKIIFPSLQDWSSVRVLYPNCICKRACTGIEWERKHENYSYETLFHFIMDSHVIENISLSIITLHKSNYLFLSCSFSFVRYEMLQLSKLLFYSFTIAPFWMKWKLIFSTTCSLVNICGLLWENFSSSFIRTSFLKLYKQKKITIIIH